MTTKALDAVVKKAAAAFKTYKNTTPTQRAKFLRAIVAEIEALGDDLINTASQESNLPTARLVGERGRTIWQLNLYADLIEEGAYVEATIDTAQPERQPLPRIDIRKMYVPLGTVVVFGASNFPFAYSTAGGDTASALAVGCPVIVKGHPAHPETSRKVAQAILNAAAKTGMPEGVFGHVEGGLEVGTYLVKHPLVKAIGFTGSFQGGKALLDLANRRKEPIPVFAEMGSVNPVFLFENALILRGGAISTMLADSVTLGCGQFCTNPGLMIGVQSPALEAFITELKTKVATKPALPMLHQGIANSFRKGIQNIENQADVQIQSFNDDQNPINGFPTIAAVSGATFLKNKKLHHEVFGPFSIIVKCKNEAERLRVAEKLEGQLTASLMAEKSDIVDKDALLQVISEKCGRFNYNTVPTGVEVTYAQQHGGPFPASTDSRFGAVGQSAVLRWLRPLAFQNFDDAFLPDALKNSNPLSIVRRINGILTKENLF